MGIVICATCDTHIDLDREEAFYCITCERFFCDQCVGCPDNHFGTCLMCYKRQYDVIHRWNDKWYYWDETWSFEEGPFETYDDAKIALDKYWNDYLTYLTERSQV